MAFDEIRKEQDDKRKFKGKYKTLHKIEKAIVNTYVDKYTNKVVQKMGYRRAVWKPCALIMVSIMYILNILACYARPDFITGIVCLLSVFFLTENDNINRDTFRFLPVLLFISMIYDFIWLFYVQDMERESRMQEGGLESPVKKFAIQVSYVAFFFKVSFNSAHPDPCLYSHLSSS